MQTPHILIVEDELVTRNTLKSIFEAEGYDVFEATDGAEMHQILSEYDINLVIMDINLPGKNGLLLARELREQANVALMFLTGRDNEVDKILGLEIGADDYITKPFGMMEFVARVKAVLRRCSKQEDDKELRCGDLSLSVGKHKVRWNDTSVELTRKEFELLQYLMENKGLVMSRNQILCHVWGYDFDGETRTVDVHVRTLRQKLGEAGNLIETVRGVGYRIGV